MAYYKRNSTNEGWLTSYADLITNLLIFFILIISASSIQTGKLEKIAQAFNQKQATESLAAAQQQVEEELAKQNLQESVRVELKDEGLEISFDSGVTFNSASADILPKMEQPLLKVLEVLKPYADKYRFAIEGHTDERPIHSSRYKSNWELSSDRAMAIRERLEAVGVDSRRIRIEAYADTRPLPQEIANVLSREEFLARHRRVVIRLY